MCFVFPHLLVCSPTDLDGRLRSESVPVRVRGITSAQILILTVLWLQIVVGSNHNQASLVGALCLLSGTPCSCLDLGTLIPEEGSLGFQSQHHDAVLCQFCHVFCAAIVDLFAAWKHQFTFV